jgi:hypothetical protein
LEPAGAAPDALSPCACAGVVHAACLRAWAAAKARARGDGVP